MNEKTFHGDPARLRNETRIALLEVGRVTDLLLEKGSISSMLDVGTGTALFAGSFAARGINATGIDISEEMLKQAAALVPAATFKIGSMEQIPFPDASFDLVFLGHVLHETDDPSGVLTEARRVGRTRIGILEWPYVQEEMGPPLAHRIGAEAITAAAEKAGLTRINTVRMKHMILYMIDLEDLA